MWLVTVATLWGVGLWVICCGRAVDTLNSDVLRSLYQQRETSHCEQHHVAEEGFLCTTLLIPYMVDEQLPYCRHEDMNVKLKHKATSESYKATGNSK